MVRTKRGIDNPVASMQAPGQYEDPQVERRPLTVEQFRKLMTYLAAFERYPYQKGSWTAHDRRLIYWTAVKTGFRKGELASLNRSNLILDSSPPVICVKARDAKNKTAGEVPIPNDLAAALAEYVSHLHPASPVFPFPSSTGAVVNMFRRDLKGAGIDPEVDGEVIDFHTLRSTAITWWLDVDGLPPKRVQVLARLKTLALVQRYSRNMRIEDFSWLNKGPSLVVNRRGKNNRTDGNRRSRRGPYEAETA